jgi:hypothetical protein
MDVFHLQLSGWLWGKHSSLPKSLEVWMIEVDSYSSLIKYKCVSSQKDHFRIENFFSLSFFLIRQKMIWSENRFANEKKITWVAISKIFIFRKMGFLPKKPISIFRYWNRKNASRITNSIYNKRLKFKIVVYIVSKV